MMRFAPRSKRDAPLSKAAIDIRAGLGSRSIVLVGMPGSGKSAVGKIIASRLGWHFLDTDKYIEERHGTPLQALID